MVRIIEILYQLYEHHFISMSDKWRVLVTLGLEMSITKRRGGGFILVVNRPWRDGDGFHVSISTPHSLSSNVITCLFYLMKGFLALKKKMVLGRKMGPQNWWSIKCLDQSRILETLCGRCWYIQLRVAYWQL